MLSYRLDAANEDHLGYKPVLRRTKPHAQITFTWNCINTF